jgi:hypothetical protein
MSRIGRVNGEMLLNPKLWGPNHSENQHASTSIQIMPKWHKDVGMATS